MAIVSNPLIGKTRKSMGNATFTTWKGINILKEKAINVANPRTDGQVLQRNKLKVLVAMYQFLSASVLLGFKERAVKMSEYNAFVSANLRNNSFLVNGVDVEIDVTKLIVSDGSLTPSSMTSAAVDSDTDELLLVYPTTPVGNQNASDILNVVLIWEGGDAPQTNLSAATRADGTVTFKVDGNVLQGEYIHVYTFFTRADGSKSSDNSFNEIYAD